MLLQVAVCLIGLALYFNTGWALGAHCVKRAEKKPEVLTNIFDKFFAGSSGWVYKISPNQGNLPKIVMMIFWPFMLFNIILNWLAGGLDYFYRKVAVGFTICLLVSLLWGDC